MPSSAAMWVKPHGKYPLCGTLRLNLGFYCNKNQLNHKNRLARPLSLQTYKTYKAYLSAEGSEPHGQRTSRRDSLFSWFSFVSASSTDKGGFAVCGVKAVRGEASHKPSPRKRQRVWGPDADTKGFLGFGFKTKMHWICRVRR